MLLQMEWHILLDKVVLRQESNSYDNCQEQQAYSIYHPKRWFRQKVNFVTATVPFKTSDYHSLQYFMLKYQNTTFDFFSFSDEYNHNNILMLPGQSTRCLGKLSTNLIKVYIFWTQNCYWNQHIVQTMK